MLYFVALRPASSPRRTAFPRPLRCLALALLMLLSPGFGALAMPPNDSCGAASPIEIGTTEVSLLQASLDGIASCDEAVVGNLPGLRDAWFRFTPMVDGPITLYVVDERATPVSVAAYGDCPGTLLNEIRCSSGTGLVLDATAGESILLRLAAPDTDPVVFSVIVEPAARISGRVLGDDQNPAVPSVVEVVNPQIQWSGSDAVKEDGSFEVALPRPGSYFAAANSQVYVAETFDDLPCSTSPCDPTEGTRIIVDSGAHIDTLHFQLDALGQISGTVTDLADGQPLAGIDLSAFGVDGVEATATTDDEGRYTFVGLPPQTYTVLARDGDYMNTLYDGVPCPGFSCDPSLGTPLTLELNQHRQGIDFALQGLGRISGQVRGADSGVPVRYASVLVYDAEGSFSRDLTDEQGTYSLGGLPAGDYTVLVSPYDDPFLPQLFPDIPCPGLACDPSAGAPVPVVLDATTAGIDFALQRGGTIRGTVRDRPSGDGIPNALLFLLDADGEIVADAEAGSFFPGQYTLQGIAPGEYFLVAFSSFHLGRVLGGGLCSRDFTDCDLSSGTRFSVGIGSVFQDVNPILDRLGVIEGRLLDDVTNLPVPRATVKAWDSEGRLAALALSSDTGAFQVQRLDPGSYTISAEHVGYRTDVYPGIPQPPCINNVCDPTVGQPVPVDINVTADIEFRLQPKAAIRGTVRADDGRLVPFPKLRLWTHSGDLVQDIEGDAEGRFLAEGLDAGDYVIGSHLRDDGYRDEVYDGRPCGVVCSPDGGTVLSLDDDTLISGIDFTLTRLGIVSGQVTDRLRNIPIYRNSVALYDSNGIRRYSTTSKSDGVYELIGVEPGTYYAVAGAYGFPETLHPNIPCPRGHCDLASGTALVIEDNQILSDVDFALDMQQGITGTVVDEATGLPISNVQVQIHSSDGFIEAPRTNAQGHYRVPLELGMYYLKLDYVGANYDGDEEAYDDVPCPRLICDPRDVGVPVEVTDNQVVEGIDFSVTGHFCTPNSITLCLNDRRFKVRAKYRNSNDFLTWATPRALSDDSGTFYFFGPDNLEILIKILNACVDPFDRFWVFSTGLTDLEVELIVEDTYTGLSKTYTNPSSQPYRLTRDLTTFDTCDVPGTDSATAPTATQDLAKLEALLEASLSEVAAPLPRGSKSPSRLTKTASGNCTASTTALCLQQDRFQVESTWVTPDGRSGSGTAVALTPDTGTFWFFDEDNTEVMIKVLDACVEPFDAFWVFAAGLTDLEVTLRVTDTLTGEVRQYGNAQGTAFVPIQDTAAFRTCP